MPTHLDSIFFAGPYLLCYCLRSRPHLSVVPRQLPVSSFLQPILFRVPLPLLDTARFQVQKPFVWFRAKTDKGIVCLAGHLYSVTTFKRRRYFFTWFAPLTFKLFKRMLRVKQGGIMCHFCVFGMTRPGIEYQSSIPLANTLTLIHIPYLFLCRTNFSFLYSLSYFLMWIQILSIVVKP